MRWRVWETRTARIEREASTWRVEMEDPQSDKDVVRFENWLRRDVAHLNAYRGVDSMTAMGKRLDELGSTAEVLPIRSDGYRTAFAAAAAVLLVVLSVVWAGRDANPAFAAVANGGRSVRMVALRDATPLTLDIGTTLEVAVGTVPQQVRLTTGRVRFGLMAAPDRRLEIVTPIGVVIAANCVIDVAVSGGELHVSLIEGRAPSFSGRPGADRAQLPLAPGRSIRLRDGAVLASAMMEDASWTIGSVAFDEVPLRRILVLANRAASPKILVADERLGDLKVTGVLDLRDTTKLSKKLAAALSLRVVHHDDAILLSRG